MVPSGNMGVFDPTEIHNRGQLKSHMKEAMIKLGVHLLCFFMYLYRWVYSPLGISPDAMPAFDGWDITILWDFIWTLQNFWELCFLWLR